MALQNKPKINDKQPNSDPFLEAFHSDIPKFYANGIQCQLSLVDGTILFQEQNNPVCAVTMALPLWKSLRDNIDRIIEKHHQDIKSDIKSVEEIIANSNIQNAGI